MAFTDHCDIFGAVHEEGFNRVVRHMMRQRPSLFNYATAFFTQNSRLLCAEIVADRKVTDAGNPLFDLQDPIPILGAPEEMPLGLNWCFQLTDARIDFHPGNVFSLPPELGELPPRRLALQLKACFGLGCPPRDVIEKYLPQIEVLATAEKRPDDRPPPDKPPATVLETREILCFCLELYAVAHAEWGTIGNDMEQQWLKVRLDGLEIVDLQPLPMESIVECYVSTVLRLGVLPRISLKMEKLIFDITKMLQEHDIEVGQKITLRPTPISANVPNNPAVEEDQLKAFISLVVEEV